MHKQAFSRRLFCWLSSMSAVCSSRLTAAPTQPAAVPDTFPTQPPTLAHEMVLVAHFNFKRVRELVDARPSLAKAAWDWGFGDWETALGAASHTGNREIAEYLIAHGAHVTLFSASMLGQLEVVKAFVSAQPGVQRIAGPHSISLLAHAKAGGTAAVPVLQYLESLGDAGSPPLVAVAKEELSSLTGTYIYGSGASDQIEITLNGDQLMFTRTGTMGRGLIYVGERAFHPAGASAVMIRFGNRDGQPSLTVHDPDLVLTATRPLIK